MNLLVSILLSVNAAWALPLEEWKEATVKVSSYPCLTEAPRFEGSGVLFERAGQIYVLTSEHVLIHEQSSKICHRAAEAALELISADFGSGLALLKVSGDELKSKAISWQNFVQHKNSNVVSALGFPVGDANLSVREDGQLLTANSRRALISDIREMLEVAKLPVEYGMSGGLLVSKNGNDYDFAGVLSHQVLKREAGKPTLPEDINDVGSMNDLALGIPASAAVAWIEKALAAKLPVQWKRSAKNQIEGKDAIQYGSLLFKNANKRAQDVWDVGGALNGGGDGAGIGGDNTPDASDENLQVIELGFTPEATAKDKSVVFANPQLEQWRQWLLSGKKVSVVFLKTPDSLRLGKITSLSQFLTLWQRDGYKPMALRSKDASSSSDLDTLLGRASRIVSLAQAGRDNTKELEKKSWFGMIRDQAIAAQNALMTSSDIKKLLNGENDKYWREYYDQDFDHAVELESAIQQLIEHMQKMGI